MLNQADVSTSATAIITALSGFILLAVKLTVVILTRSVKGEKAPFHAASIDFGSYRIRVSRRRPSGSSRKKAQKCAGDRASTSTVVAKAKGVSLSNSSTGKRLPPSPERGSIASKSFDEPAASVQTVADDNGSVRAASGPVLENRAPLVPQRDRHER